ncbi:MAG: response regulator, partial [Proteobacteria bacterium]|nr:response regulator [Pseudomonadota bacterium]
PSVNSLALAAAARQIAAEPASFAEPSSPVPLEPAWAPASPAADLPPLPDFEQLPDLELEPSAFSEPAAPAAELPLPPLELTPEAAEPAAPAAAQPDPFETHDLADFPSTDFLDFEGETIPRTAEPQPLDVHIDFLAEPVAPAEAAEPGFEPTALADPFELRAVPAADAAPAAPAAAEELPAFDYEAFAAEQAAAAGVVPASAGKPADQEEAPAAEQANELLAAVPADESLKVIGPLRIGIALYNVYLNEADEWSRQLAVEVGEWAMEPHLRVQDSTIGLAHSLAGSSATVGFRSLSDMARQFESALAHLQMLGRGTHEQGTVLALAADELRRLLHQFAAGVLKDPSPDTLQALRDLASAPMPPVQAAVHLTQPLAPAAQHAPADVALEDSDDAMDVADAVDADLFPIFEEEAADLLPQLANALRAWAELPDDMGQRAIVLRALHTLKGSARLAGAMRLGERAHRMESEVELIGVENIPRQAIEELYGRYDALQAAFDSLRAADGAAQAEIAQRAVAATSAVPTSAPMQVQVSPASEPSAASSPFVPSSASVPAAANEPALAADAAPAVSDAAAVPGVSDAAAVPAVPAQRLAAPASSSLTPLRSGAGQVVRIRTQLLDRLVAQAGEVIITRSRLEAELGQLSTSLVDLTGNLDRLRQQLRDIEVQAESQMQSRLAQAKDSAQAFDPLEFDRFTRVQELTRMMAESVNDVATVQRSLQKTVQATEDDLSAQARQTRELQRGLLRTRMVEFEGISERLYRVVRQASKDTGKQVRLDITGGSIEMDRGVLDRMTPAFEHLLRNCVAHGIEDAAARTAAGKDASGLIVIDLHHEGNDVSVSFRDDGAGLNIERIARRAHALGLVPQGEAVTPAQAAELIFQPGFSTAEQVSELAGRGIGMDVVRADVAALGGRIETQSTQGQGTAFKLVLPLTTAVTHVVMMRAGELSVGVPSNLVELVQRVSAAELEQAYASARYTFGGEELPFYWSGALLQSSARSDRQPARANTVVVVRSAAQRVALHVDEVLGNQEVVVKNLGPQLSTLPGLAGISVLASGAVALIYNPVAVASVHGEQARAMQPRELVDSRKTDAADAVASSAAGAPVLPAAEAAAPQVPLVLVVDDSITVRRVTQRLLQREGYRVALAADGLQALERLQEERPALVLSDIEMPRMDGFDLARNIRADESLAGLPIIMITSRIAEKHREHAKQLGVNHYLGKPYSEEELLRLVRSYTLAEAVSLQA